MYRTRIFCVFLSIFAHHFQFHYYSPQKTSPAPAAIFWYVSYSLPMNCLQLHIIPQHNFGKKSLLFHRKAKTHHSFESISNNSILRLFWWRILKRIWFVVCILCASSFKIYRCAQNGRLFTLVLVLYVHIHKHTTTQRRYYRLARNVNNTPVLMLSSIEYHWRLDFSQRLKSVFFVYCSTVSLWFFNLQIVHFWWYKVNIFMKLPGL